VFLEVNGEDTKAFCSGEKDTIECFAEEKNRMFVDQLKVGDEFNSPSKTITDAHYLWFSGLTGDNHPSHYDVEYCRKTRYGKTRYKKMGGKP
jgi:acyl dehydratase